MTPRWIASWTRRPWVAAAGVPVLLAVAAGLGLLLATRVDPGSSDHGELVDQATSADGHYRVEIRHWQAVLGEDGWDVVLHQQDGLRGRESFAGCLYSENGTHYRRIESIEPGVARLVTEEGPLSVTFDPATLKVLEGVPAALCRGFR